MAIKTYVLLEHTRPSADVFIQVNKSERVRMNRRILDHAYLRMTFTDREGNYKTIRLKTGSKSIDQSEQIKAGILANAPFTQTEKDAVRFSNGVLMTGNITVQEFLEASPQYDKFWVADDKGRIGFCDEIVRPLYTLYDERTEIVSEDQLFLKRLKAANKIASLNLEQAQSLMIRLNGSFFKTPNTIEECRLGLVDFMDNANDAGLDDILRDEDSMNIDERATVLIGKAIKAGVISFDRVPNQVVKMKNGAVVANLKEISSEYDLEERKRYFAEFLTSNDGKLLYQDLEKEISAKLKKQKEESLT